MKKPFIKLFKTRNCCYIYDVNTNLFLKINEDTYKKLQESSNDIGEIREDKTINTLVKSGYLSSNKAKKVEHPMLTVLDDVLEDSLNTMTLQITQQCNLRCSYCVYSGNYLNRSHSQKEMDIETAKKGIDFVIEHSKNSPKLNFSFYGGEPLLRFDFIKECVKYARERSEGKEVTFNMTTNATLINDEIIEYIKENNISIAISMDGPKEIHDKNRLFANGKGSFDKIIENAKKIKDRYPEFSDTHLGFNVVMDGETDFNCINDFFVNYDTVKDSYVNASVVNTMGALDEDEGKITEDFIRKHQYEKFKVLLHELGKLKKEHVSPIVLKDFIKTKDILHKKREVSKLVPEKIHPGGPCVPGLSRLFMDVNGQFYPCERISEESASMKIGAIDSGFDTEKIKRIVNVGELTEEKCLNCWAYRYCTLCASFADDNGELSGKRKSEFCSEVKDYTEKMFKTYCTMKEFGYVFED